MRKLALIPTREESDISVVSYLKECGFEVHLLVNQKSIFSAYKEKINSLKLMKDDLVILCHDDIEILLDKELFTPLLEKTLNKPDVGFVGVAGTKHLGQSGVWWDGLQNPQSRTWLSGAVYHGESLNRCDLTYFGPPSQVVVLDGVFLAAKGKTLNSIQLDKPKSFSGEWDFYDIWYTYQTNNKKLKNFTLPIPLLHSSIGQVQGRDSWHQNREAFIKNASLPLNV
jgi:hypothetical protein